MLPGLRSAELTAAVDVVSPLTSPPLDLASPFAPRPNHLQGVVWSDIFGTPANAPLDRAAAMTIPAVARGRNIICGTVGRIPLAAFRGTTRLTGEAEPSWINSTSGALPAYHRNMWTADDHLFYGWSCWARMNDAAGRTPLKMDRIPMGRWSLDDAGRVKLDRGDGVHELVDQRTVCLIPGPHEGILVFGQRALRHYRDLMDAVARAAETPAANVVLQQESGTPLLYTSDDPNVVTISTLLADWRGARKKDGGGVGYVPPGLKAIEMGTFDAHLLESGRNAAAVDIARLMSLPADLLDAASEASLTYSNARDNDVRAIQYGVGLYLTAISAALSQDAITPHGQTVRFDLEDWLEDPTPQPVPARPAAPTPQEQPE